LHVTCYGPVHIVWHSCLLLTETLLCASNSLCLREKKGFTTDILFNIESRGVFNTDESWLNNRFSGNPYNLCYLEKKEKKHKKHK
jgi:hypothetical protein